MTVATASIFFPSFVMVIAAAPRFGAFRGRPWFEPALHGAMLSFVGLLVSVTAQFSKAMTWSVGSAVLAALALVALRCGVDVLWVVLATAAAALAL